MLRNWIPWLWRSPRSVIGKWRPRRAKGLVLVWVQRLENQESEFVCEILSESESEGRRRPMSQLKDNEEREKILTLSFILSEHAVDWKRPTLMEEGAPLYSARWSRCESPADSLPDTSRVRVRQILGCPMTCTVKHHTILSCHCPPLISWSLPRVHGKVGPFIPIIPWGTEEKIFLCFCTVRVFFFFF